MYWLLLLGLITAILAGVAWLVALATQAYQDAGLIPDRDYADEARTLRQVAARRRD